MLDFKANGEAGMLFPISGEADSKDTTYRLGRLEVYNWGPFNGLHRAEFDSIGTAIIGPTGSGKTTLVDALMTLLVAHPRYNLASTGGHESDRTLPSYIRGELGGDGSTKHEDVLRPGKTVTGVCATYEASGEFLRLAALFWFDSTSTAATDLKRRWIFSQADDQSLEDWLRQLHDEGLRELTRTGRETAKLRIYESKTTFLTQVRKFFDVSENAFTLLNRAAGLKQLNSIDDIFRDLVLDDRSAFGRALEVASEFDNLAAIHAELETARRQQESLVPIADEYHRLERAQDKAAKLHRLRQKLPIWFATVARDKWTEESDRLESECAVLSRQLTQDRDEEKQRESKVETLRERYLSLGGNVIEQLEQTITAQQQVTQDRTRHASDYSRMVRQFSLSDELTREALQTNKDALRRKQDTLTTLRDKQQSETLSTLSQERECEQQQKHVESLLRKAKERPGSNIPPQFQDFRAELATQLAISEADLPFLAELVEVKQEEMSWRGAIERAIGSDRLRILVPENALRDALQWINRRDNRLHVRLQRARIAEKPTTFLNDGFSKKLNLKSHPLVATAKLLLAARDLHCVDSAKALQATEFALTIEGMMSGRGGKYEKQDQRRPDQDWMTGFDNKDQLEALTRQHVSHSKALENYRAESKRLSQELMQLDQRLRMIDRLMEIEFDTIDLHGAETELSRSLERLSALKDPLSGAAQANIAFTSAKSQLEVVRSRTSETQKQIAVLSKQHEAAGEEVGKAQRRMGRGLSDDDATFVAKHVTLPPDIAPKEIVDVERDTCDAYEQTESQQKQRIGDIEKHLVQLMGKAHNLDTGALIEVGTDIADVPHYLERLRLLNEEALPEKRSRFLEYLNRSSDQGVTQLLASITEEVDAIENRIKELNHTLARVDFKHGRYLQLQAQRIKHERLRALEAAIRKVRTAALKDGEGESHFKALKELVEILRDAGNSPRKQASRALLDPRYRLQFFVVEVDRQTGNESAPRTGSQSGSGGEKELMASHILTASLSYALCPAGTNRPLYGTVILDEAFSKSSPSAASRIIEALRIFWLHPIFVTPNKEIGLLKQHTRRVICVQRPAKEASLASISWERLEELSRQL